MNEVLETAYPYFDALDNMARSLDDDDIKLKSDAQFWPNRLQNTVQETEDSLVADEQRYKAGPHTRPTLRLILSRFDTVLPLKTPKPSALTPFCL